MIAAGLTLAALAFPMAATAASTITYTYDVFGQLVSVSSTAGRVATYTYDAAGNRTNLSATGTTALNTPTTEVQIASLRAAAPVPASRAYANNQAPDTRRNDRDKTSTAGVTPRALR
jgi:YD repeat-containing protein